MGGGGKAGKLLWALTGVRAAIMRRLRNSETSGLGEDEREGG